MASRTMRDLAEYHWKEESAATACQLSIAKARGGRELLATSPALSAPAWDAVWRKGLPAVAARGLVSRPLLDRQVRMVLEAEARSTVLASLCEWNSLPADEAMRLARHGSSKVRDAILRQDLLPRTAREGMLASCSPEAVLRLLVDDVDGRLVGDEVLVEALRSMDYEAFASYRTRSFMLQAAVFARPAARVFAVSPEAHLSLATAAASCPLIDAEQAYDLACRRAPADEAKFLLMALAANPAVPAEIAAAVATRAACEPGLAPARDQVTGVAEGRTSRFPGRHPQATEEDPVVLRSLVFRALPSDWGSGRPFELALLRVNAALEGEQRTQVGEALDRTSPGIPSALAVARALGTQPPEAPCPQAALPVGDHDARHRDDAVLDQAAESLGACLPAWETLVLMIDEFEGSFEDLVRLAEVV